MIRRPIPDMPLTVAAWDGGGLVPALFTDATNAVPVLFITMLYVIHAVACGGAYDCHFAFVAIHFICHTCCLIPSRRTF